MGSVKRFAVSALGVGRKDYSVNVEASVEAMIRSHQLRVTWNLIAEDVPTLAFPECYWLSLFFMNYAGGLVLVAPSDVRYAIYGLSVSGRLNALTICGLDQFESIIPGPVFDMPVGHIKTVARAFGFSKAELQFSRGHPSVAGRAYALPVCVWSDQPTFSVSVHIDGIIDKTGEELPWP